MIPTRFRHRLVAVAALAALIGADVSAQASGPVPQGLVIQPHYIPAGGDWILTIYNTCPAPIVVDFTDYKIDRFDDDFTVVTYVRSFSDPPVTLPVGGATTLVWDGTDDFGLPVQPGSFGLRQRFGPAYWSYAHWTGFPAAPDAPASQSRYVLEPAVGRTSYALLQSPSDAGRMFAFAIAFGSGQGTPTCGGLVPLDSDPLLEYVLGPSNTLVAPLVGVLDARGCTPIGSAPRLTIPDDPTLYGFNIASCFVILDPLAACIVRRIGDPIQSALW